MTTSKGAVKTDETVPAKPPAKKFINCFCLSLFLDDDDDNDDDDNDDIFDAAVSLIQ